MKLSRRLLEDLDADDDVEDDHTGSSRATANLPKEPPFYVFVSPLQPGLGEKELREFFIEQDDDVVKCEFKGQVSRVELKTRDSLARAVFYSGRVLCGREVCVDLSPPGAPAPPQATSSSKEQHAREQHQRESLRPSNRDRQPPHRDAPDGNSERGFRSGGYRRGPSDQQYERGSDQRYRGPRHGESERVGDRQQQSGGQPGSQGPDGAVHQGETDGAVAGGTAGESGEKPTYKRLQLKPRTKTVGAGESQPPSRNASIFGSGNPHDEIAYERKKKETTGTGEGTATDTPETAEGTDGDASSRNNDAKPSSADRGSTISSKPSPWKTVSLGQHHKDGPHHKHREGEVGTHRNGQSGRPYQHHKPGASWEKVKDKDASKAPQPVKKNEKKTPKKVLQLDEEGFVEVVAEKHHHGSATKEEPEGEPSKAPLTDNTVSNAFAALDLESEGED